MARAAWGYRMRQLGNALRERRQPIAHDFVRTYLAGDALALFYSMTPRDQAHSLNTAWLLAAMSEATPELIVAGLLHDVAKGRQQIWERVLYVLLDETSPALLRRLARQGGGTRGALYRSMQHAPLGAGLAAAVGLPARVCDLIARHHEAAGDDALRLLQWADAIADAAPESRLN